MAAIPKALIFVIASLFLSFIFIQQVHSISTEETSNATGVKEGYNSPIDCKAACTARCSLSSRPNLCKRACGTCCYRCNCVPPGTSGNLEVCPCYANMKTRGNKSKCP